MLESQPHLAEDDLQNIFQRKSTPSSGAVASQHNPQPLSSPLHLAQREFQAHLRVQERAPASHDRPPFCLSPRSSEKDQRPQADESDDPLPCTFRGSAQASD